MKKFVEIYQLNNDGTQSVAAVCRLEGDAVVCEGNENLIRGLIQEGIKNYASREPKKLFPKDGIKFLEQLKYNFKSGYLNASDIKEN